MYLVSDGTANDIGAVSKHNTLLQAKKDLKTRIKSHETFCRKHDKETLIILHQAVAGVDSVTDVALMDVPARAWVINIGGINRHFRLEVIHG
jgi:hypothetical protein